MLSAFLLSSPFFAEPALARDRRAWGVYFVRRFLRIFPPLFIALLGFHFLIGWDWRAFWLNFLCVRGTGVFWTVFAETRYYLLLPAVIWLVLALERRPRLAGAVLLAGLVAHLWWAPFYEEMSRWRGWGPFGVTEKTFVQYLPVFIAGTLLAWAHQRAAASPARTALWSRLAPFGFWGAVALLVILSPGGLSALLGRRIATGYYHGWWTPLLPLIGPLVFFAVYLEGWSAKVLCHPAFRFIGKISYSGYLFHFVILHEFMFLKSVPVFVLCVASTTFVFAAASHFLVERPFIALGHRINLAGTRTAVIAPS